MRLSTANKGASKHSSSKHLLRYPTSKVLKDISSQHGPLNAASSNASRGTAVKFALKYIINLKSYLNNSEHGDETFNDLQDGNEISVVPESAFNGKSYSIKRPAIVLEVEGENISQLNDLVLNEFIINNKRNVFVSLNQKDFRIPQNMAANISKRLVSMKANYSTNNLLEQDDDFKAFISQLNNNKDISSSKTDGKEGLNEIPTEEQDMIHETKEKEKPKTSIAIFLSQKVHNNVNDSPEATEEIEIGEVDSKMKFKSKKNPKFNRKTPNSNLESSRDMSLSLAKDVAKAKVHNHVERKPSSKFVSIKAPKMKGKQNANKVEKQSSSVKESLLPSHSVLNAIASKVDKKKFFKSKNDAPPDNNDSPEQIRKSENKSKVGGYRLVTNNKPAVAP